jgi:protein-S-isoprenylcysteine O-methyltransferase Ste14
MDEHGTVESQTPPSKSTGSLKAPTGSLEGKAEAALPPLSGGAFGLRLAELATFLVAIIGAVALGLGITDYFAEHPYVSAYLAAYAGFRLADLLVGEDCETTDTRVSATRLRRIIDQLPLLAMFAGAPFERTYFYGGEAPSWLGALGLLLELVGLWLALGARIQLGFFSSDESGARRRRLVRSGFYRHIRHPICAGELLVLFAWSFEYGAPVVAILTLVIGWLEARRGIAAEEAAMLAQFGDEYAAYVRETDCLIPSLW